MRSVYLAAAFLVAAMAPALAGENNNGNGCRNRCGDTINNVTNNRTVNRNTATATSRANSSSTSSSRSRSNATSSSGGNRMSSEVNVGGDKFEASAIAPNIALTSHGCIGSSSAGFGNSTLSIGGGTTEEHRRCTVLEGAKILAALGDPATAKKLVLSIDWIKEALDPTAKEETPDGWDDYPR